jgi:hypothetical protein
MLFPEKTCNCLGKHQSSNNSYGDQKHFLGLVHVFGHFMGLQKDITNQFNEIIVIIIGEEILKLNGHQSDHESKEGHFCVFMRRLF